MVVRISNFEDLSNEFLREIFQYLSIEEQFSAFYNLNQRINQCLLTHRCHLTLRGTGRSSYFYFNNVLPLLPSGEHVTRLRLENIRASQHHSNLSRLDFPKLRSLSLINIFVNDSVLTVLRAHGEHLEFLDMSENVTSKWNLLLPYVLSLPKLKRCRLMLGIVFCPLKTSFIHLPSPIEHLTLSGLRMRCSTETLATVLSYFPHLKTLRLICEKLNVPIKTCRYLSSNLKDLTIELDVLPVAFVQLTDFVAGVSPNIDNFTFRCSKALVDGAFLIPSRWSDFLDRLSQLKKLTLDFPRRTSFDDKLWNRRCAQLRTLMSQRTIEFDFYSKCFV